MGAISWTQNELKAVADYLENLLSIWGGNVARNNVNVITIINSFTSHGMSVPPEIESMRKEAFESNRQFIATFPVISSGIEKIRLVTGVGRSSSRSADVAFLAPMVVVAILAFAGVATVSYTLLSVQAKHSEDLRRRIQAAKDGIVFQEDPNTVPALGGTNWATIAMAGAGMFALAYYMKGK